jgi:hypothetical protein
MPTMRTDLGTMGSKVTHKTTTRDKEQVHVVIRKAGESVEDETVHRNKHWSREYGMLVEFYPVGIMIIGEVFGERHDALVRGHPSIPLLPLSLTMSICIPHSPYTYPTTPRPLRPSCDHRRSSSIYRYSTIQPTWSQPRLMPRNYHLPQRSNVTRPYGTLRWSLDFHIWKAWY